jgi:outer membrane protein assembly factor BamD
MSRGGLRIARWTAAAAAGLALLVLIAGCRSSRKVDPILRLSAEEALSQGKTLLERKKYAAARPYFSHAFEVEPNSAAGREALLLVADTLFAEGNTTNLIEAEAKYRDYQNRFPTSNKSAYVQYQIARTLGRRIVRADRDQSATQKALDAYQDLLRLYPTSEYADQARNEIQAVRDRLAEHELLVGYFYYRYGLAPAAVNRLKGLLDEYPDYGERDRAMYYLVLSYRKEKKADEAQATLSTLRQQFPQSRWTAKLAKLK